jgi:hypothetical protein
MPLNLDNYDDSNSNSDNESTIEVKKEAPVKEKKPRSAAQIAAVQKMIAAKKAMGNIAKEKKEMSKQIREAEEIILAKKKAKMDKKIETANAIKEKASKQKVEKKVMYSSSSDEDDSSSDDSAPPVKRRSKKPFKVIINNTPAAAPSQAPSQAPVPVKPAKPNMLFI